MAVGGVKVFGNLLKIRLALSNSPPKFSSKVASSCLGYGGLDASRRDRWNRSIIRISASVTRSVIAFHAFDSRGDKIWQSRSKSLQSRVRRRSLFVLQSILVRLALPDLGNIRASFFTDVGEIAISVTSFGHS